jgi:selenocysteine lyase/cysteine desulfurase
MVPLRQGGTGSQSESDRQPDSLPDRLEAGNLNVPGLLGMAAGIEWVMQHGVSAIARRERELAHWLEGRLMSSRVQLYGHQGGHQRVAVVSLNIAGFDPQELASAMDATAAIQVRAGLHCAPHMHRALGTDRLGGTVRISLGPYNTREQLQTTAELLETLAAGT